MNVRLEQLASHLKQGLKPVYIVSGDEPLQMQEACQLIRSTARAADFDEREVFNIDPAFKWEEFISASSALSLFAARKLIELRLPGGKPGSEGSKALLAYAAQPAESNLLLISTGKLDKATQNSKWFKALDKVGAHIAVWPIDIQQLPQWIERRMRQAGLTPEREAVKLLAEHVDGNLLAAVQEIEKLQLLLPPGQTRVSAQTIHECVVDSARYSLFKLADEALAGNRARCVKMLSGLREEGAEPLTVVWLLSRELRQLALIQHAVHQGSPLEQAMQSQRIWRNRQGLVGQALGRLSEQQLNALLQQAAFTDQLAKGMHAGNVWDHLEHITLTLAGAQLPSSR